MLNKKIWLLVMTVFGGHQVHAAAAQQCAVPQAVRTIIDMLHPYKSLKKCGLLKPENSDLRRLLFEVSEEYTAGQIAALKKLLVQPDAHVIACARELYGVTQLPNLWGLIGKGEPGQRMSMAFSPDKTMLAVGSSVGSVYIWDLQKRVYTHRFTPPKDVSLCVETLSFTPDGKKIVAVDGYRRREPHNSKTQVCTYSSGVYVIDRATDTYKKITYPLSQAWGYHFFDICPIGNDTFKICRHLQNAGLVNQTCDVNIQTGQVSAPYHAAKDVACLESSAAHWLSFDGLVAVKWHIRWTDFWDLESQESFCSLPRNDGLGRVAFSSDRQLLAIEPRPALLKHPYGGCFSPYTIEIIDFSKKSYQAIPLAVILLACKICQMGGYKRHKLHSDWRRMCGQTEAEFKTPDEAVEDLF